MILIPIFVDKIEAEFHCKAEINCTIHNSDIEIQFDWVGNPPDDITPDP